MTRQNNNLKESGNVFIIILAGVALFAALAFTFTSSSKKGTGNLSKQQAKIAAQEILSYARLVEQAVDRVRRNGCSENEISFENDVITGYENTNAPPDNSCHIFEAEGGRITFEENQNIYSQLLTNRVFFGQGHCIKGLSRNDSTCTASNSALTYLIGPLKNEICLLINDSNDIQNIASVPPNQDLTGARFQGDFANTGFLTIENQFENKLYGCARDIAGGGAGLNYFYYTLLIR